MRRVAMTLVLVVAGSAGSAAARAQDVAGEAREQGAPAADVPAYQARGASLPPALAAAADAAIRTILAPPAGDDIGRVDVAIRRLAAIGSGALPRIAEALASGPWRARAGLVGAVAEMDAADATPLLVAASRDPAFAVREAAVVGLGKTGDRTAVAALAPRAVQATEPAWRVRAAAAAALRRLRLRGVATGAEVHAPVLALLADDDEDVRHAALANIAPLAIVDAMPTLLGIYADGTAASRDRALALGALRAYRVASPELIDALRRGFTTSDNTWEAVRAGRALIEMRGASVLDEREVSDAALRHLMDEGAQEVRDTLGRLGKDASPWLARELRGLANRIALRRADHDTTPFDSLLDALLQVDEAEGIALLKELLGGPDAPTLERETRLSALRRVQVSYAVRLAPDVRALWTSEAGRDLRPDVLRAIASSGGDDRTAFVAEALRHEQHNLRGAALDVLESFASIAAPPELRALAEHSPRPAEQMRALVCLGRRDSAAAGTIAAGLIESPEPAMRENAVRLLGAARDDARFKILVERLAKEDGRQRDAGPAAAPDPARGDAPGDAPGEPGGASDEGGRPVTSDAGDDPRARSRRRIRAAIARMLATAGGPAAHPILLGLLSDAEPRVREVAAQELRELAAPGDAAAVLARLDVETDEEVRGALVRLLARLDPSPAARAHFAAMLAVNSTRPAALRLLSEAGARVVPDDLEQLLADPARTDDERLGVLRILERGGRLPSARDLAAMARVSRTIDCYGEILRMIASRPEPAALAELLALTEGDADHHRLSLAIHAIGEQHNRQAVAVVLRLFDSTREVAFAAADRGDATFQLHRACAVALGRIGGPEAGAALADEILDPRLAARAGRTSVLTNGPFQPQEDPVPTLVRTLAAAFAHFDEAEGTRLLDAALARRAADCSDRTLDEGYVDGVARYLHDPAAFDLPPRRRTAVALRLWTLVATTAPRFSALDADALELAAIELESAGRPREAAASYRASLAVADVEDASRSEDDRRVEAARLRAFDARVLLADGRRDEALAIAATLRDAAPTDPRLAFRQGWLLIKLGAAGPQADVALRFTAARDERDASARFWLGWIAETASGAEAAIPAYTESLRVDAKIVDEAGGEYLTNRNGRRHRWGHHGFYLARALAASGAAEEDVAGHLRAAVRMDDRYAAQARADGAFARFGDISTVLDDWLAQIPHEPLR